MMSLEFRSTVVLLITVSAVVNVSVLALSYVAQFFDSNDIVADVILKAPTYEAVVIYPSGVEVNLGNELTPTQVRDIPTVVYNAAPECFYTLALVDPDVPSRVNPVFREWKHWLVVNIPGNYVALGETLAEYVGSAPPIDTGLHRYVFLVYQQPDFLEFDEPRLNNTSAYKRTMFSIEKFAVTYGLGVPIAGNFFQAQYDDYVPILNEQLDNSAMSAVARAFADHEVETDMTLVAPDFKAKIKFPSGVQANLGNELTPTQVKDMPNVSWKTLPNAFYTLVMSDPDAPSRTNFKIREWQHWLVANIPGDNVAAGETLSGFVSSGPLLTTGIHRYVFLVYKQLGKIAFDEPRLTNTCPDHRSNFSTAKFAKKYNLGHPIAGNFYQAQYDDNVPNVFKQLGLDPASVL